ncbi:MAG: hypothetical protein KGL52_15835, partial [Rhodospirillales bacterium]|nr:hypothetical protein [Rhodospirillales bacterium]
DLSVTGTVGAGSILLSGRNLAISGLVSDGGAGSTSLIATGGSIAESGRLIIGALSGSSAGATSLVGANAIAALDAFTAGGGLTLDDGGNLTVVGPVSAGPAAQISLPGALTLAGPLTAGVVTLNAGSLALDSTLTGSGSIHLTIGGDVGGPGSIDTPQLTGSSGGATNLTSGGNRIGAIDTYSVGSVLNVVDGEDITLAGVITAPLLEVNAAPHQVTIANGTTIVTGGIARPADARFTQAPTYEVGAYLSDFVQQGAVSVTSPTGGYSILEITTSSGGNIAFDPKAGLTGQKTWMILNLPGQISGFASGNVFVRWLDVFYAPGSSGGGASLGGSINGITGQAAAGAGFIHSAADTRFRINACAIASVNCIILPVEVLPLTNPLEEFSIGSLFGSDDDDQFFLPLVSRRDY